MSQQYSNLEVDPVDRHTNAPEVFPYYAPEPYQHHDVDTSKAAYATTDYAYEQPQAALTCGLRRRTFWIIVIAASIVVLAAVGGGIGGALASRPSNSSNDTKTPTTPPAQSQPSATHESSRPTPTSTESSKTITTTTIAGPTATILRDCPSSNDSLHDVTLGGMTMYYRKACDNTQPNPNGIWNAVQGITKTLDDCIDLCASYNNMNRTRIQKGEDRICNSVCWRNTFDKINDWEGGHCFGFTSLNSSGTFSFKQPAETRCDSAMLINQQVVMEL